MDSPSSLDDLTNLDTARLDVSSALRQLVTWTVGAPPDVAGFCTLRDGASVLVRPIRREDMQRVRAFHLHLSPQTLYLRFGRLLGEFPDALVAWLACVDGDRRMAFAATNIMDMTDITDTGTAPSREEIIAIARYEHVHPQVAEMAAVVTDSWQGRGLGPLLLYRLALYARSRGYTTFIAPMNRWNGRAVYALMRCGLPYTLKHLDEDTLAVSVDITPLDRLYERQGSDPFARI